MTKTVKLITGTVSTYSDHSVEEYVSKRGFNGLKRAMTMEPIEVIDEIIAANLLGRGGAAYPAGYKWRSLYKIEGDPKYIVCNADEGEPGTFKDRLFLQDDPFIVIEGMIIAGLVFNAKEGYIYIRGEYRDLHKDFQQALDNAKAANYLGDNILGSDFSFDIHIVSGAGAYVCGENSTLLNSIEGKAGRPRVKPPHLAEIGLYGQPTLVNNVETFANIPIILDYGVEKYLSVGTPESGGSLITCLSGHAKNPGYYEVPVGTVLRDIIYDESIGNGLKSDKALQFVHIGGQSGPLAFPEQIDTHFDHKSMRKEGLAIGTAAVVVVDETIDLIDYLKKVALFFIEESCGKCTPCREGNVQVYNILDRLSKNEGRPSDVDVLWSLSDCMSQSAFCGLGQAATTALQSALRHREEAFTSRINQTSAAAARR